MKRSTISEPQLSNIPWRRKIGEKKSHQIVVWKLAQNLRNNSTSSKTPHFMVFFFVFVFFFCERHEKEADHTKERRSAELLTIFLDWENKMTNNHGVESTITCSGHFLFFPSNQTRTRLPRFISHRFVGPHLFILFFVFCFVLVCRGRSRSSGYLRRLWEKRA